MQNARLSSATTTVASSDDDLSIDPALFEDMRMKQIALLKEKQNIQETDLKSLQRSLNDVHRSLEAINEKIAVKNTQMAYTRKEVENLESLTLDSILNVGKSAE